jgi:hypothetical protein
MARAAATHSGGSLERAALWCDESLIEFRCELLRVLSQPDPDQQAAAKLISQFVDEAGKEAAAKRQRLRLIISLAEEFYRALLLAIEADKSSADDQLAKAVTSARRWLAAESAVACLDICLATYAHIDANANQATLIEWLVDELVNVQHQPAS